MGKEAIDDDDKNDGHRDRRRSRRGDGETSAHPLLSLALSPTLYFSLHFSLLDILYYTHKKFGEDCPCSFGAKPSNKSSSKAHNPLTRQSERRSIPHSHLYSPEPHPKITSTTHEKSKDSQLLLPSCFSG